MSQLTGYVLFISNPPRHELNFGHSKISLRLMLSLQYPLLTLILFRPRQVAKSTQGEQRSPVYNA